MTRKEQLNRLFIEYNLDVEDTFKHPHYQIITRSGIDKIQANLNIKIEYDLKHYSPERKTCVIKAVGQLNDVIIETYGEASPDNNRNAYPVAIAEKRAMSRVVLKLSGLYSLGVFGEDESDDFKRKQ
tara:strand:+ start:85 stop:465 length:381 start_codon:yes stop_codon:yes gene_type:complete